ncbi:hypothetical protein [Streptomyces sp. bgisy060]|uniref:hypothetical protein n=1 Tax=Streptomyces sp. bgisy060 TaxID=3413775 RepID=UPI003EB8CC91
MTVHHALRIPEHAKLRADAMSTVKKDLGALVRPDEVFTRACEIVQQADLEIAAHVEERNQAALSLFYYDGVRGLAKVMGILPNAYREMRAVALHGTREAGLLTENDERMSPEDRRAAAEKAGVLFVEDAHSTLPELSATVSVANARRKAAMPFLQDAALALTEEPYSWSTQQIAELGGVTPKYVRDVKNRAAKRRRG